MSGPIFGNLGANARVQEINANWNGIWTASIHAIRGQGLFDCILTRFNTLMTSVPALGYLERQELEQFLQTCVQFYGAPPLSTFKALAADYAVGTSVLIVFRDQRRDWPMILGRNQ